jgi:hypothetical protein
MANLDWPAVHPPEWLAEWTIWRLKGGNPRHRPPDVPQHIDEWARCFVLWVRGRLQGAPRGERPPCAPRGIPRWAWVIAREAQKELKPPPPPRKEKIAPERYTWVECEGYYGPVFAEIGRQLDDAGRWHGWPNCIPLIGIGAGWEIGSYPELQGRAPWGAWRWEMVGAGFDWEAARAHPGCYVWTADGFEAGTGTVNDLAEVCRRANARGVFLQAGHADGGHAQWLRNAGLDVQVWASASQISPPELKAALDELKPSRFCFQIEGKGERVDAGAVIASGAVLGDTPWDTVISGWGDFAGFETSPGSKEAL